MFGHVVGWAFDWAMAGLGPSPSPIVWLLRAYDPGWKWVRFIKFSLYLLKLAA